jgi:HlyD family secretion protein
VGEVGSYVRGNGIVLRRGGAVFDAVASDGGKLVQVAPALGDTVTQGEVMAETYDEATMERYTSTVALADERMETLRDREGEARHENTLNEQNIARQRANLEELERTGGALVENAQKRLQSNLELLDRGLVDRTVVEASEEAVDLARRNLFDVMRRRNELNVADLSRRNAIKIRLDEAKQDLLEAERQVKELEALMETWRIRAPVSGRVSEIKAQVGTMLDAGQAVLGIETGGESLDVLIYVSSADGRRVKVGMPVLVSPTTVRSMEFGSMIGTVESISEFPVSLAGMTAVLQNEDLARTFSISGPPYAGRVVLTPDATTTSGFAWTSPKGADMDITAGMLAEVEIEIDRQPPVALVMPLLKDKFGL